MQALEGMCQIWALSFLLGGGTSGALAVCHSTVFWRIFLPLLFPLKMKVERRLGKSPPKTTLAVCVRTEAQELVFVLFSVQRFKE